MTDGEGSAKSEEGWGSPMRTGGRRKGGIMSLDPVAQFDQALLEMIELSPTGVVPHTPSHQEALKHLLASHQVYPSADYKGGYVTVRSLAGQPVFCARNLEAYLAGEVEEAELEPDASIFGRYLESLPEEKRARAEECRAMLVAKKLHHRAKHGPAAHDPVHTLVLVPGAGRAPGLPGNYLHGSLIQTTAEGDASPWALHLHDAEDGASRADVATKAEALEKWQEVLASAPFLLAELEVLGFRAL